MAVQKFEITNAEGGTAVLVQVSPNAARNRIARKDSDIIYVDLAVVAEHEAVDEALQAFFAQILGINRGKIAVASGKPIDKKIVIILDTPPEKVEKQLVPQP